MLATFSDWQSQGVFLVSVSENLDFTTIWGKLILVVLSMLAEIFVTNLRQETKKGLRGKFAEGIHNGWLPWGYCRGRCATCADANGPGYCPRVGLPDLTTGRELVAHPIDSQAFRYAQQLYCTGRYSDRDIADALNRYQVESADGVRVQVRSRAARRTAGAFHQGILPGYSEESDLHRRRNLQGVGVRRQKGGQASAAAGHQPCGAAPGADHRIRVRAGAAGPAGQVASAPGPRADRREPAWQERATAGRAGLHSGGRLDCATCGAPLHAQGGSDNERRHVCSTRLGRSGACAQRSVKADILEAELTAQMNCLRLSHAAE